MLLHFAEFSCQDRALSDANGAPNLTLAPRSCYYYYYD